MCAESDKALSAGNRDHASRGFHENAPQRVRHPDSAKLEYAYLPYDEKQLPLHLLILELRTIIHTHKASSKMAPSNSSYNKTMGRQLDETEAVQSTPNDTCDSANNQGLSERISYLLLMQRNEILKDPEHFRLLRKNIYMISS
jgi:hypothetical protein